MKQGSTESVLKIVMDDMEHDEAVAYLYQEGEDAVIVVSRHLPDDVRCSAVNELLSDISVVAPVPTVVSRLRIA